MIHQLALGLFMIIHQWNNFPHNIHDITAVLFALNTHILKSMQIFFKTIFLLIFIIVLFVTMLIFYIWILICQFFFLSATSEFF